MQPIQQWGPPVRPTSGLAVASMICGIAGLIPCFFALPCVAAVILGHLALAETANGNRPGHGQAITGLILGYPGAVIIGAWLVFGSLGAVFS